MARQKCTPAEVKTTTSKKILQFFYSFHFDSQVDVTMITLYKLIVAVMKVYTQARDSLFNNNNNSIHIPGLLSMKQD